MCMKLDPGVRRDDEHNMSRTLDKRFIAAVSFVSSTLDTKASTMESPKNLKGAGIAFLGVGVAFLGVTVATHLFAFMGVGTAFIGVGIVFLAKSRQG